MDPGTIVALVGIGVLFFLVLFIWFMIENSHKKVKSEFKFATGAAIAYQQQITDTYIAYANYIIERKPEIKETVVARLDIWMATMNELIEPAEVAKIKSYMMEKLDITDLEQTTKINQEIVADLLYASSGARQAILSTLNNLDNYLYDPSTDIKTNAKTILLSYQVGTSFAGSLANVAFH